MNDEITDGLLKLQHYIEKENYQGFDPYDALASPIFKLPFLNSNYQVRFLAQQFIKRFPFNIRPLLNIKKSTNPVTLGLCIQGYTNLAVAGIITNEELLSKCSHLITILESLIPKNYSGACWGYDFPWQSRHFALKAYQPSIVATGIITNALFQYYEHTKSANAFSLCESACNFISNDLNKFHDEKGAICFSYTPFDNYQVYNANMKGVRTLAQVFSVTNKQPYADLAKSAASFVTSAQNEDGSWFYAPGSKGKWIDNYHTGYVLECLHEYSDKTRDFNFHRIIQNGYNYYITNLFEENKIPKFFNNDTYPIDCTSGAQAVITLCRFGEIKQAENVALFMVRNMQAPDGSFYFRKHKNKLDKTVFMRWSNAWMFAALARIICIQKQLT
jgi:hypothetical protein